MQAREDQACRERMGRRQHLGHSKASCYLRLPLPLLTYVLPSHADRLRFALAFTDWLAGLLHTMLKLNLSVIEEASEEPSYRGSDSVLVDNILGADVSSSAFSV